MLDKLILQAVEAAFHFGFPLDAGAVLIMEVDGLDAGLTRRPSGSTAIAKKNNAREVRQANTEAERLLLWKAASRRSARSAGWPRATARKTASCRGPSCRRSCAHIQAHRRRSTTCASATSSMPATATFTRSCCSTNATPIR